MVPPVRGLDLVEVSGEGGEVNAAFVSLPARCAMHQIEPWSCLHDILCLLSEWPRNRDLELARAHSCRTVAD